MPPGHFRSRITSPPWKRLALLPLLCIASLLWASGPTKGAADVEIETVNRKYTRESPPILSGESKKLEIGGNEIPLRDVLTIHFPVPRTPPRGAVQLILADGTYLIGDVVEGSNEEEIHLKVRDLQATLKIPLELIRQLTRGGATSRRMTQALEDDTLETDDGSTLRGLLLRIDTEGVAFEDSRLGALQIPWKRFLSTSLAELDPPEAIPENSIATSVELSGGGKIKGALITSDDQSTAIRHPALGEVRIPGDRRKSLGFDFGRIAFLSDREPTEVEEGTPYSTYFPWHWRKDRSVVGGPLRIGSTEYERGLGVHARCSLEYSIEAGDKTFISDIGIDASGRPTDHDPRIGIVVFKVLLDDKVAFQSDPIGWQDSPRNVVLSLEGASRLTLVVDTGPGHHVLDRADWGNARIIRD